MKPEFFTCEISLYMPNEDIYAGQEEGLAYASDQYVTFPLDDIKFVQWGTDEVRADVRLKTGIYVTITDPEDVVRLAEATGMARR